MLEKTLNWIVENLTDFGYWNYIFAFIILILCGFGVPIPEDITLVAGGLVSGLKATNVWIMLGVCFAGVLMGDASMYTIGRIFGYRILQIKFMRRFITPERFESVQAQFEKYGIWVLFAARFMPGLRSPIFMAAGMSQRVPFAHFIIMDGLAALISVPVWVFIAYYCAESLEDLIKNINSAQSVMHYVILAIVLISIFIVTKAYIKKKAKKKAEKLAAANKADKNTAANTTNTTDAEKINDSDINKFKGHLSSYAKHKSANAGEFDDKTVNQSSAENDSQNTAAGENTGTAGTQPENIAADNEETRS
jgi:membrane protein DedA with SNARE-associated domain